MKVGLYSGAAGGTRIAALFAALLTLTVTSAGCGMMHRGSSAAVPSDLRVGISPNYPPLAFKEGTELKGVEVDFAHLLGKQLGVKTTLIELPWDELLPALVDGKIDVIMSGMSITEARTQYADFTVPYMAAGQMVLVRKVELRRRREETAMDQPGSRVGVIQGSTGDTYARRTLKQATVMGFTSVDEAVAALRGDRIDYFIADAPSIWTITARSATQNQDLAGLYRPLTSEFLAWAVRKDNDPLRRQLNDVLLLWEQNGQQADVLDEWIRTRRVTLTK